MSEIRIIHSNIFLTLIRDGISWYTFHWDLFNEPVIFYGKRYRLISIQKDSCKFNIDGIEVNINNCLFFESIEKYQVYLKLCEIK